MSIGVTKEICGDCGHDFQTNPKCLGCVLSKRQVELVALREENARLKASCLNQCADNLCWLSDPEVGKALPESEFLESCRRYRNQIAGTVGELKSGTMTIAQLEASNAKLCADKDAAITLLNVLYSSITKELSEPYSGTGALVEMATLIEKLTEEHA